ncbi:MAG TPA: PIN domain-containing protein [Thermoanaerobaculia bacterium]|nr:PIN domain-containing protein [Thermoanaerobaculia bacterium]
MSRIFVDTSFVVALINQRDRYHELAGRIADANAGRQLLTTDAILLELGNALARGFKRQATEVIEHFLTSPDVEVIRLTPEGFERAFELYRSRIDKSWGLVDCLSFVVMRNAGVEEALAFDDHFAQAGFRSVFTIRG